MIIAGAGGHGLEVFQSLLDHGFSDSELFFFDEDVSKKADHPYREKVIHSLERISELIQKSPAFCLGVGSPSSREKLFQIFHGLGGELKGISHPTSSCSDKNASTSFDRMAYSFVGPNTKIGNGVLINVRANIHHDCRVGEYSEIGPGAMLLGGVRIGKKCRIGAGAVILPGVSLADEVIVGAGAVVTKDCKQAGVILKGVPAK